MPCDTRTKRNQTLQQRAQEVRDIVARIDRAIVTGGIKVRIGPKGGIAFVGLTDADRDGVTDACAYRRLMATGSALARAAIAKAEQLAGRTVDRQALAQGLHAHSDGHGGITWHNGH